jgi:hypothetical protein
VEDFVQVMFCIVILAAVELVHVIMGVEVLQTALLLVRFVLVEPVFVLIDMYLFLG